MSPPAPRPVPTRLPLEMVLISTGPVSFAAIALLSTALHLAQGGICWSGMNKKGRCIEMLSEHTTREQCCEQAGVNTAWSSADLDSGNLFFLRVLGGGVHCTACKESCSGVECGKEKKCVVRGNRPKCVCAPACKEGRKARGPVCGTDGRSYRNVCRLRKRACRKRTTSLSVAYHGFCQSSCEHITCPTGKFCLLDQNLSPHCVRCAPRCGNLSNTSTNRPVCGTDGVTYPNTCVLRQTACRRGKAIPVAYKGRCKELASCGSVRCRERQECLQDLKSGRPRCVTCASRCTKDFGGPICGSDNHTYASWCHMLRESCDTGYVIDTAFSGRCISDTGGVSLSLNTVLEEDHDD